MITQEFLPNWGVHHRISSKSFQYSNCGAEIGVKTAKRLITDNTGPYGELDTNNAPFCSIGMLLIRTQTVTCIDTL